jgi:hypothetical protein
VVHQHIKVTYGTMSDLQMLDELMLATTGVNGPGTGQHPTQDTLKKSPRLSVGCSIKAFRAVFSFHCRLRGNRLMFRCSEMLRDLIPAAVSPSTWIMNVAFDHVREAQSDSARQPAASCQSDTRCVMVGTSHLGFMMRLASELSC